MKILVTGASGFIGSHLAETLLQSGHDVWCAVRKTTSRQYLQDQRLNFIELNLSSKQQMTDALQPHRFDAVVHAAGATKCLKKEDFFRINTDGTRNLVEVIEQQYAEGSMPRFVFVSSLSVVNSIPEEKLGEPTMYGESKFRAEQIVRASRLPYVILRPTGVYGPREKDYFLMVQSIKQHTDFAAGYSPQIITFVYVSDVVQAIMKAMTQPAENVCGHTFALSDGEEYTSEAFSDLIISSLEKIEGRRPWVLRLKAPLFILRAVCALGEVYIRLTGKLIALNNDKYNILSQRDWRCDISDSRRLLGYDPKVKLEEGVMNSVKWYKENKWI